MDKFEGWIENFRVTKGGKRQRLPWYRRLLMRLIGRSHWRKPDPFLGSVVSQMHIDGGQPYDNLKGKTWGPKGK